MTGSAASSIQSNGRFGTCNRRLPAHQAARNSCRSRSADLPRGFVPIDGADHRRGNRILLRPPVSLN